jgi:hypothetical protein
MSKIFKFVMVSLLLAINAFAEEKMFEPPLYDDLYFLGVTGKEQYQDKTELLTKIRSEKICKFLGYQSVSYIRLEWAMKSEKLINVTDDGLAEAITAGDYEKNGKLYLYSWFEKLGCRR